MADTNLTITRGDTMSFGLEYEGTTQDLDTAYFTCRKSVSSEDIIFQKSIGSGITKAETSKYIIRVAPEDTRYLDAGVYYYDFQIGINGDIFTLLKGALIIEQDFTY